MNRLKKMLMIISDGYSRNLTEVQNFCNKILVLCVVSVCLRAHVMRVMLWGVIFHLYTFLYTVAPNHPSRTGVVTRTNARQARLVLHKGFWPGPAGPSKYWTFHGYSRKRSRSRVYWCS